MQIAKFCLCISSIFIIYETFTIYQQTHYKIKEFFKFYIKQILHITWSFIMLTIYLVSSYKIKVLTILYMILYEIISYKRFKVKLVCTNRIKRLYILTIPLLGLIYFNISIFLYLRYLLIIPFLISSCLEYFINRKYFKKAVIKRKEYSGDLIAVTGSFGKTTTKHFLSQMLGDKLVLSTPKSYNTPMGISKVLNNEILEIYDCIILEMGASKKGDISYLSKNFKPNIGIVVSIGNMHLNGFGSIDNIIKEKMSLIESLPEKGIAILNYDNDYIRNYKMKNKVTKFTYGFNNGDFRILDYDYSKFSLYYKGYFLYEFNHNQLTKIEIEDLVPSLILGIYYKIPYDVMEKSILNLTKMNNRLQIRHDYNLKIYDDSYNSNLKGSLNALESISKEKGFKFIITPGFVEMDLVLEKEMKEYAEKIDKVIDYKFIIHSRSGDILYDMLNGKNAYLIDSFLDGYKIVKNFRCYHSKTLLIENDLTDYYERMNI